MKTALVVVLCMACMLSFTSADYSFDIISSTDDNVVFDNGCDSNNDCKENGQEYCGKSEVHILICDRLNGICNVTCNPLNAKSVETNIPASFSVLPRDKRVGMVVEVRVREQSGSTPIICDIDIYFGGRWKSEQVEGASHWGGSMTVVTNFVNTDYVDGKLVLSTHTNRQGVLEFTPTKPGRYVLRALNRYVVFSVGDVNGDTYNCSNGVCETTLGEDETVCPQDCNASAVPLPTCEDKCGDGTCQEVVCEAMGCPCAETATNCPQDCAQQGGQQNCAGEGTFTPQTCCQGLTRLGAYSIDQTGACVVLRTQGPCSNCGNGICSTWENVCNCPQDCTNAAGQQPGGQQDGGDMTLIIILVVGIVAAILVLLLLVKSGMFKAKPKSDVKATPAVAATLPANCPKCGASTVPGVVYCTNCGTRLG